MAARAERAAAATLRAAPRDRARATAPRSRSTAACWSISAATTTSAWRSTSTWSPRCRRGGLARRRQRRLGAGRRPPRRARRARARGGASGWATRARCCLGSGYLANLAVLQALLGPGDVCVQDKLNHACLLDGARLAGCELKRYPHGDAEAAMRQLMSEREGAAMLATDGVFSMDGDLAPLRDLALLSRSQDALLYVDDAHGVGVLGPEGRGSVAQSRGSAHARSAAAAGAAGQGVRRPGRAAVRQRRRWSATSPRPRAPTCSPPRRRRRSRRRCAPRCG